MRTRRAEPGVRAGRMAKAEQFYDAADAVDQLADETTDMSDATVTLWVHAGIRRPHGRRPQRSRDSSRARTAGHSSAVIENSAVSRTVPSARRW